ncbi:ABC transporter ATP-binding protein [Chitinophaga caseinilytica]|uniref:ABC transporter ATP-binding protein n=1 Tax=Chitinophaga caseinilytica TaxID=2267521 RepID=A0ABZ2YYJ9_9BACT
MSRLHIHRLTKKYGSLTALNGLSLSIPNGMFGLLGPNGAGKSTLMRTLATLQPPDEGQILFDGTDILRNPDFLRSRLGYLPQDFGVYPRVSALSLLHHLAILKGILHPGERREQVDALLHQTHLYHVRKRAVSSFSGGMRQRFGIAQALLGNPQLLIADEPTAGLDPLERNRFHDLLSEVGEQIVVILSTHIVEDVHDLCQDMAILAAGNIILRGKPSQLTESIRGRIWRKSVEHNAVAAHQLAWNVVSVRLSGGKKQVFVLSDSDPGQGFEPIEPGLELVYFTALNGAARPEKESAAC